MAGIQEYLEEIKNAVYGRDVRQAIHDGIHQCYEDGKAGAVDLVAREEIAQLIAPSGEAPSAAEVTDARIGADGTTYTSLGDAVRGQASDLKSDLNNNVIATGWELGSLVSGGGGETPSNQRVRSGFVRVTEGTRVTLSGNADCLIVYCYDEREWYMSDSAWSDGNVFVVPPNVSYIRVLIRASSSNPNMTSDDVLEQASRCTVNLRLNQNAYFNTYTDDEVDEIKRWADFVPNIEEWQGVVTAKDIGAVNQHPFFAKAGDSVTIKTADASNFTVEEIHYIGKDGVQVGWNGLTGWGNKRTATLPDGIDDVYSVYIKGGTAQTVYVVNNTLWDELKTINNIADDEAVSSLETKVNDISTRMYSAELHLLGKANKTSFFAEAGDTLTFKSKDGSDMIAGEIYFVGQDGNTQVSWNGLAGAGASRTVIKPSDMETAYYCYIVNGTAQDIIVTNDTKISQSLPPTSPETGDELFNSIYGAKIADVEKNYKIKSHASRLGYIWMSDMHINSNNSPQINEAQYRQLKAVSKVANETDIDFVCLGGDINDGEDTVDSMCEILAKYFSYLGDCKKPVLFLLGNHDDNSYKVAVSKDFCKGFYTENSEYYGQIHFPNVNANYFYFDIDKKYTRIICLDSIDYEEGSAYNGTSWWSLSEEQVKWFCNTALDTDYRIVVLSHMCPDKTYNFFTLGDEGGYHTDLMNVMSAYNNHSSITLYGNTYDFSNRTGEIVLFHAGHTHTEPTNDITVGGVPCIITACAKVANQQRQSYETPVSGQADTYYIKDADFAASHFNSNDYQYKRWTTRSVGTINECLFDVVSVNSEIGKAYTFRVGAGEDREFSL